MSNLRRHDICHSLVGEPSLLRSYICLISLQCTNKSNKGRHLLDYYFQPLIALITFLVPRIPPLSWRRVLCWNDSVISHLHGTLAASTLVGLGQRQIEYEQSIARKPLRCSNRVSSPVYEPAESAESSFITSLIASARCIMLPLTLLPKCYRGPRNLLGGKAWFILGPLLWRSL